MAFRSVLNPPLRHTINDEFYFRFMLSFGDREFSKDLRVIVGFKFTELK